MDVATLKLPANLKSLASLGHLSFVKPNAIAAYLGQ